MAVLIASEDTYIVEGSAYNFGSSIYLYFGAYYGASSRALLRFDLSSLTGPIQSVSLNLYIVDKLMSSGTFDVYRILSGNTDWIEGTKSSASPDIGEPNWQYKFCFDTGWAGSAGLSTADTDYDSSALGSVAAAALSAYSWVSIPLDTDEVEKMRNGTYDDDGFLVRTDEVVDPSSVNAYSRSIENFEPYLDIEYAAVSSVFGPSVQWM